MSSRILIYWGGRGETQAVESASLNIASICYRKNPEENRCEIKIAGYELAINN